MRTEKTARLWNQAYEKLLDKIRGMRAGENRLEPEESLARELEVSRATVREIMQSLAREGYITRRHGSGNYAHPSVAFCDVFFTPSTWTCPWCCAPSPCNQPGAAK